MLLSAKTSRLWLFLCYCRDKNRALRWRVCAASSVGGIASSQWNETARPNQYSSYPLLLRDFEHAMLCRRTSTIAFTWTFSHSHSTGNDAITWHDAPCCMVHLVLFAAACGLTAVIIFVFPRQEEISRKRHSKIMTVLFLCVPKTRSREIKFIFLKYSEKANSTILSSLRWGSVGPLFKFS